MKQINKIVDSYTSITVIITYYKNIVVSEDEKRG